MLVLILLGMFIGVGYEAIKHYNAEKYARHKVYGEETHFFSFMLTEHPCILIVGMILIALIGYVIFATLFR